MDEIETLYKQFTIELSSTPIPEHEVRGITLETFRVLILQERDRAFLWGTTCVPEPNVLEVL